MITVTNPTPVNIVTTTTTTTPSTTLTVRQLLVNVAAQQIVVAFVGHPTPVVISGADFTAFQSAFSGTFAAAITAYLAAHPISS